MRVLKTKEFMRFARKERVNDESLCDASRRAQAGLIDADLGAGLIKQRVARPGQGRSGGYRTLMAFRSTYRTVFVYGFAKSERENIGVDELDFWRRVSTSFLKMNEATLVALIERNELNEVNCGG